VVAVSGRAGALAWVALVPWVVALSPARPPLAVLAGAVVYTVVFALGDLLPAFVPATAAYFEIGTWRAAAGLTLSLTLLSIVHGAALGIVLLGRPLRIGPGAVLWYAAVWACWEVLRSVIVPYYPGAVLGVSQHDVLPVLQVASLCGIAGVTFTVVAVNVGVAACLRPGRLGGRVAALATGLAVAALVVGGGRLRLARQANARSATGPEVLAIDVGALEPASGSLGRYLAASPDAAQPGLALVAWPESALLADVERDRVLWGELTRFVGTLGVPLLAGGPGSVLRGPRLVPFNSMHLVRPGGTLESYHKRHPVPVAERWPAVLGAPPAELSSVEAGDRLPVFTLGESAFGVLICFEITDAAGARALANRGARFIVNATNDAWFVASERPPHLEWAAVRAVETGLPILRVANAGPSLVVDRYGRVVASSRRTDDGAQLRTRMPGGERTFYARAGDVFLGGCALVVLAGVWQTRRAAAGVTPPAAERASDRRDSPAC
jgi:apolipoprotein N-acyltransferase